MEERNIVMNREHLEMSLHVLKAGVKLLEGMENHPGENMVVRRSLLDSLKLALKDIAHFATCRWADEESKNMVRRHETIIRKALGLAGMQAQHQTR